MFEKGGEVKRKIRAVKVKTLDFYWLHDVTDLDRMINSPLITIESFEDLLSYRKYLIPTELCDFNNEMIKAKTEEIVKGAESLRGYRKREGDVFW